MAGMTASSFRPGIRAPQDPRFTPMPMPATPNAPTSGIPYYGDRTRNLNLHPQFWGTGRYRNQDVDPMLKGFFASFSGSGGGGADIPRVTGPLQVDRRAAEAAEFGRAKDRIGQATQGLMKAIRGNMSRRGITGSSIDRGQTLDALTSGAGQLGEVVRDQSLHALGRDEAVEDRDYAGNITQRGQDIGQRQFQQSQALNVLRMLLRY